jgi:hypothetical protein
VSFPGSVIRFEVVIWIFEGVEGFSFKLKTCSSRTPDLENVVWCKFEVGYPTTVVEGLALLKFMVF